MNNPESGMMNKSVNAEAVEEIRDCDNLEIRKILTHAGVVKEGDVISADDYETTRTHAMVLAKESTVPVSTEALMIGAFVHRMRLSEQLGDETLKSIPDDALRGIVYVDTGHMPTSEELRMLRQSPLSIEDWEKGRLAVQEGDSKEFDVAVDEDAVIARGTSPQDALHRARDDRGQQL